MLNRGFARFRIQRRGFKNNIRFRYRQPLIDPLYRWRLVISSQELCDIDRILACAPTHPPRRNTYYLPLNPITLPQLVRLRHEQPRKRTPNITESKEAESVSFHV